MEDNYYFSDDLSEDDDFYPETEEQRKIRAENIMENFEKIKKKLIQRLHEYIIKGEL